MTPFKDDLTGFLNISKKSATTIINRNADSGSTVSGSYTATQDMIVLINATSSSSYENSSGGSCSISTNGTTLKTIEYTAAPNNNKRIYSRTKLIYLANGQYVSASSRGEYWGIGMIQGICFI